MAIIPGPLVPGPESLGRRYGLLAAALGPLDLSEHGRGGGVRFEPTTCGDTRLYTIACEGGSVVADAKTADANDDVVEALPFVVYASIECGAVGYTGTEFENKVRRRLENGEQRGAERALWSGEDENGDPLGITSLADGSDLVSVNDPASLASVVAALEGFAYGSEGYGNTAFIHAPASLAALAAEAHLVERSGTRLVTPLGSVWVFGGGYDGSGDGGELPPAGGAYLYVTGQVTVYRSPDVFVYPADQTMDRTTNQRFLLAEREYAIGVECLVGRALFDPEGGS